MNHMLVINFIPESYSAKISLEGDFTAWGEIRRVFIENSKDVTVNSANSLQLPWWSFLNCKDLLRLTLRKFNIKLSVDPNVERLLRESNRKTNGYREAIASSPISDKELLDKLSEVGFKRPLTEHQVRNVSRLAALTAGATFSVPGAGKTTEALALFFLKRIENARLLIVAPKNAFAAWEEQINICNPRGPQIVRLRGGTRAIEHLLSQEPEVMLITYQQLPNVIHMIGNYISKYPAFMFLDESHRIKRGNDGVIGRAILSISHIPDYKLIMSGTPLPNSSLDLVSQFNFLYPEIRVDAENIVDHIRPVYVRTTKEELGLKKPRFILTPVQMSVAQRRLYDLLRFEEARQLTELHAIDRIRLRAMGRSIMRMLQVTSNPALLAREELNHSDVLKDVLAEGDSQKIKYICKRVRQLASQNKKTLVWSTFVENVELLALRLRDLGAEYIHGGVDAGSEDDLDTREAKIKRFHDDDKCFVLIANPAAASEGISLHTVCHDTIYLDRSYNAAHFLQSVDRIHRLGLPRNIDTNVEIVYCPESVDESVERRLQLKINRMAEVLNDRSLQIEPEYGDEETMSDDFNDDDLLDFVHHLRGPYQ